MDDTRFEFLVKKGITILRDIAQQGELMIGHGNFAQELTGKFWDCRQRWYRELLFEIGVRTGEGGEGALSALVTRAHKEGGKYLPGDGIYNTLRELGRDLRDEREAWIDELEVIWFRRAK